MTKTRLMAAVGALVALLGVPMAWSAGLFPGLPVVGAVQWCGGYSGIPSGTTTPGVLPTAICNVFVPAGPTALTGVELVPADTQLAVGAAPQSVGIPTSLLSLTNFTNKLIGGDFTTNPNQVPSTTKGLATITNFTPTAAVITADRWWVVTASGRVSVSIDSTAATAVVPGLNNTKALRVARTTGSAAGLMCTGQTLDAATSAAFIGNNAVFSFYESNGAGMSATGGNFTVNVDYTSAADAASSQATIGFAGTNGSLFALGDVGLLSAGPTNMTRAISGFSNGTTSTITAGVATITGSTTWTRYGVYAAIPTNIPGTTTPVTSISVSVCFTPTATTAIATDYIELEGLQLEAKPGALGPNTYSAGLVTAPSAATLALPNGVTAPSAFERRPLQVEAALAYQYWYYNFENQSALTSVASCSNIGTTSTGCHVQFPVVMRIAPTVKYTAGFQAFASTTASTLSACSALAAFTSPGITSVPGTNGVDVLCTATVGAAGSANQLMTLGTSSATGVISASAEP